MNFEQVWFLNCHESFCPDHFKSDQNAILDSYVLVHFDPDNSKTEPALYSPDNSLLRYPSSIQSQ